MFRKKTMPSPPDPAPQGHQETRSALPGDPVNPPPSPEALQRFSPDPNLGLTLPQVKHRFAQGLNNGEQGMKTKTEGQIIRENTLTFFNIIHILLALLVILVGSTELMFLFLIFWNTLIGSVQGIRSKRTIDKLSLISSPKAVLIRDGHPIQLPISDIVLDDILCLKSGHQICSDAIVVQGEIEVNESLITGESDPITKKPGDPLLSGSFVVSGSCSAQVEHVGEANYSAQITSGAKYIKKQNSAIMNGINQIIKVVGFVIIPVGLLLFSRQYFFLKDDIQNAVTGTVTALLGMIPEGLILLTSVVFAVAVIRLSRHQTLVQDLYCVETLARVDTLCLDKTGTLTEGTMQVDELLPLPGFSQEEVFAALIDLTDNLQEENPTFLAIRTYTTQSPTQGAADPGAPNPFGGRRSGDQGFPSAEPAEPSRPSPGLGDGAPSPGPQKAPQIIPFSSGRKWSGVYFPEKGSYLMGAGEFILGPRFQEIAREAACHSAQGKRVLLVAHSPQPFGEEHQLPGEISCIGLVILSDRIRREAPRTLRYFADQGVDLKIISGDNAVTVSNIAKKAGLETAHRYVDATTLQTEAQMEEAVQKYSVFGRVTPQQKLAFVTALKKQGRTVAMTGDGVNDVLALKEADCSIAMASGSDAARTVSSLVLLDSNFSAMPKIVEEGRRSINNLQRSASLYLAKTIFFILIDVLFIFLNFAFPFSPNQLTLISMPTIGVPSFLLALEPNRERLRGNFLGNVLRTAFPAGLTRVATTVLLCAMGDVVGITQPQLSTLAVVSTAFVGFLILFHVSMPFNGARVFLFAGMLAFFLGGIFLFPDPFELVPFTLPMLIILLFALIFSIAMMVTLVHFINRVFLPFSHRHTSRRDMRRDGKAPGTSPVSLVRRKFLKKN